MTTPLKHWVAWNRRTHTSRVLCGASMKYAGRWGYIDDSIKGRPPVTCETCIELYPLAILEQLDI